MNKELAEILGSLDRTVISESVRIATGPELDYESLVRTETVIGDLLKLSDMALEDSDMRERLIDSIAPLFKRKDMPGLDEAKLREWIERASAMGVDLLLEA
jgi:hypothetical protein